MILFITWLQPHEKKFLVSLISIKCIWSALRIIHPYRTLQIAFAKLPRHANRTVINAKNNFSRKEEFVESIKHLLIGLRTIVIMEI